MYPQTQKKLCLALFRICCTARLFSDRILTVVHFSKRKSISKLGQISKSFFRVLQLEFESEETESSGLSLSVARFMSSSRREGSDTVFINEVAG